MATNQKVDVLSVLDAAVVHTLRVTKLRTDFGLKDARNAVDELIEASTEARERLRLCIDELCSAEEAWMTPEIEEHYKSLDRLNAALARIGSEATEG
jgi:hypothetical protein